MGKKKSFDCVEMKNEIQARHRQEYTGLSDDEVQARVEQKLATSDDPVARKWRAIGQKEQQSQANR